MSEDMIQVIARVIAWSEGTDIDRLDVVAKTTHYQDAAQQCAEDLGVA